MNKEIYNQLNQWHEENEHAKIIEAIFALPESEWDYDVIGLLARAYNNQDMYEQAIATLMEVKEQGENDALWLYRLGYAYYYSDRDQEALEVFERCKELDPEHLDVDTFIEWIQHAASNSWELLSKRAVVPMRELITCWVKP